MPKYIKIPQYIFQSLNIRLIAGLSNRFIRASATSADKRAMSRRFSSSDKNFAVSGQSTTTNFAITATIEVTSPSRMNILCRY